MRNDLPPGVHADDIAQDVAEMINRQDSMDRETVSESEARKLTDESTRLRDFLHSVHIQEVEGCVAELMGAKEGDDSVFFYEMGSHATIWYRDYEITFHDGQFFFEGLELGLENFWDVDLRNGLREAKANKRDNRFLGGKK